VGLREHLLAFVKAHVRGRVTFDEAGESTYHPPGSRVRYLADWIAVLGGFAYLVPLAGAFSIVTEGTAGYPEIYPGIHPRLNVGIIVFGPLFLAPLVWIAVTVPGWKSRLGVTGIGLAGTALTWGLARQVFVWALTGTVLPPNVAMAGLGVGSVAILLGGLLGTAAAAFGQWAKQFDDR